MEIYVTILGRGGHASRPDKSYNPIDCFTALYGALQTIPCSINRVSGGNSGNIIPESLDFWGKCDNVEALQNILEHICPIYHCSFNIHK